MRYKILLSLMVLTIACSPKLRFKMQNATVTAWFAGKDDGINGHDYNIFFSIPDGVKPVFDSIWLDGRGMPLESKMLGKNLLEVKSTFIDKGSKSMQVDMSPPAESPIKYKGAALLRYKLNNEIKYITVKEFNKTEPIYMP